ncbi:substrate-binding domain-containing protein [Gordoniibacillus kamchatkensis]|nr:substrate-binding domain-containing protein [Paenibacillus sp. VKM B-2647]
MVKSAYRALNVLELLANRPAGLSFTEILHETGLAKSTVHELMQTLVNRKYAHYRPLTKTYVAGARVLTLGVQYLRHSPDMRQAAELARLMASCPGAKVRVGVLSGERVVIVQEERAEAGAEPYGPAVGAELPLTSALGKALLCLHSEEEIRLLWETGRGANVRSGQVQSEWEGWRSFVWQLREVRSLGFAFEADHTGRGQYSISVPVWTDSGEVAVAVCLELAKAETDYADLKRIVYTLYDWCQRMNPAAKPGRAECGGEAAVAANPIYVSLPNLDSQKALEYLHTFEQAFQAEKLPWLMTDGHDDEWKQRLCLELAMDKFSPRCIIISPVDAQESDRLFRAAAQAGIPAVCFQRPSRSRFADYYVGGDGYEQGVMQMEYVAARLKGRGHVLLLEGDPYNDNARNMSFGHQTVLAKYGERLRATSVPVLRWSKEESRQIVAELLASGEKLDAVVAGTDHMAEGVVEELVRRKLAGKIIVVGGDGDASAVRLIKARQQHATVFQHPAEAARTAARVASALASGQADGGMERKPLLRDVPGKEVYAAVIPYTFYDASNIAELEAYWARSESGLRTHKLGKGYVP